MRLLSLPSDNPPRPYPHALPRWMKTRASGRLSPLPLAGQLVPARGIGLGVPPVPDVSAPYLSIRMMIAENGSVRFSNQSHQMPNRMISTVPLIRSMAQGCRLGRCSKSAAIWGTPDVLLTWSQGQPLTQSGRGDQSMGHLGCRCCRFVQQRRRSDLLHGAQSTIAFSDTASTSHKATSAKQFQQTYQWEPTGLALVDFE